MVNSCARNPKMPNNARSQPWPVGITNWVFVASILKIRLAYRKGVSVYGMHVRHRRNNDALRGITDKTVQRMSSFADSSDEDNCEKVIRLPVCW